MTMCSLKGIFLVQLIALLQFTVTRAFYCSHDLQTHHHLHRCNSHDRGQSNTQLSPLRCFYQTPSPSVRQHAISPPRWHRSWALTATMRPTTNDTLSESTSVSTSAPRSLHDTFYATAVPGPPRDTKPDYERIHGPLGPWMDKLFMLVFRRQLEQQAGAPSTRPWHDFAAIPELATVMNRQSSSPAIVHARARAVLLQLFPSWMPPAYAKLFSRPFPKVSI
jgi:hypothetical protein